MGTKTLIVENVRNPPVSVGAVFKEFAPSIHT